MNLKKSVEFDIPELPQRRSAGRSYNDHTL